MSRLLRWIPNILTISRLGIAGVFVWLLCSLDYATLRLGEAGSEDKTKLLAAFLLFVLGVFTDVADGYLARRMKVVSKFGRVVDPLADKILVGGGMIILAVIDKGTGVTGIAWWMVAVVLGRELLVSILRHVSEHMGVDFSATWAGKSKMILQSIALGASLIGMMVMPLSRGLCWLRDGLIWAAVIVTVLSLILYLPRFKRAIFK
ncbi:MAG: CDP-alcohol phosphatidyltransferase family protein [Sedimentisphaerales bacterium]|nr:CDP-alcohol phosphatidyltransferase family protein [Sedimentisphaerales bacterium]